MLQRIHDVAKGWFAYVIVALLIIPFALWGIQQYFGSGGERVAAVVNGTDITAREVANAVQEQKNRLRGIFGGRLPANFADDALLRQNALDELIRTELLRQEAMQAGFRVADPQVLRELARIEAFQEDGVFSATRYEQVLAAQRLTKTAFEDRVRGALQLEQLEGGVRGTAFAPAATERDYARLAGQTRDIVYALFRASAFEEGIEPTEEQIEAYYQKNKSRLLVPEQVKVAYVELSLAGIAQGLSVSDEELRAFYEEQAARYRKPEERRVSHILVKVAADADAQQVEAARAKAEAIKERLRAGEDFSVVAKETSEDGLTAASGGDLGSVRPGDFGPVVDEALADLSVGEVSAPVRTEFGFQILKLTAFTPATLPSFEQLRAQLASEYRARQAETVFADRSEQLVTLAYENAGSLQPAADAVGGSIETSGWITRQGGSGIGAEASVREAAFSEDVLRLGHNSDLIELSDGRVLVLRLLEHRPPTEQPLEAVRADLRAALIREEAERRARSAGESLLAEVEKGVELLPLARAQGAEVFAPGYVGRRDSDVPAEVLTAAYSLARPDAGKARAAGVTLRDGGYAVVSLRGVRDGEFGKVPAGGLGATYGSRELEAFYRALEGRADVKRVEGDS